MLFQTNSEHALDIFRDKCVKKLSLHKITHTGKGDGVFHTKLLAGCCFLLLHNLSQEDCKVDGRLPGSNVWYSAPAHQPAIAGAAAQRSAAYQNVSIF